MLRPAAFVFVVCAPGAFAAQVMPGCASGSLERVTLGYAGQQAALHQCVLGGTSADGRYSVFTTSEAFFVPLDFNVYGDVFVRDRVTGSVERITPIGNPTHYNPAVSYSSISADGNVVVFDTNVTFAPNDPLDDTWDVYAFNRATQSMQVVTVGPTNQVAANNGQYETFASADGRYVAFTSFSHDLVPNDNNHAVDAFVRDLQTGQTQRISVDQQGLEGSTGSWAGAITPDGRYALFFSSGVFDVGDSGFSTDIYVCDRQTNMPSLVSRSPLTGQSAQQCGLGGASISDDGRFVLFASASPNLVVGDTNGKYDVFLLDRTDGLVSLVSVAANGGFANHDSYTLRGASLSTDLRWVAFGSSASNLVAGDTNGRRDTFVRDRVLGRTLRVGLGAAGAQPTADVFVASLSSNGRFVTVTTNAALVGADTNGTEDGYLEDLWPRALLASYCTGGTTTLGCTPTITACGIPSASLSSPFTLTVGGVEGGKPGLIFYGMNGRHNAPWGSGSSYLCVRSPLQRTNFQFAGGTDGACDGALIVDWVAWSTQHPGALGQPLQAGDVVWVQGWYRDPPAPKTTSLSDALEILFAP